MRRTALGGLLLAVLAPVWAGTAAPATAAESSCAGVWVVVDYGSLGGVESRCATSYSTGAAALRSAGFGPTIADGFVEQIGGKPVKSDPTKAYWSYWQATLKSDGTYSGWSYSNLGATASHPQRGNAEGWRYQSLSDGKVPPGSTPPKGEASPPKKPTPTPSTKPSAKPSATTKAPKPTATASVPKSPTTAASASASGTSAAPTSPASPTPGTADPAGTSPAPVASDATAQATAIAAPDPAPGDGNGSPAGLIAAAVALVGGGGGLGAWWYLRGRVR